MVNVLDEIPTEKKEKDNHYNIMLQSKNLVKRTILFGNLPIGLLLNQL